MLPKVFNTFKYHISCTDGTDTQETKKLKHPTRPIENVALTTKGLQKGKHC